ncbi:hypothetical protein [uncultured Roseobacter sp.]|uniref:hypothetical protein n=1 Tax=uncultured Roseobacter sp. TaxID=114847 RepID=UPI0026165ED4|nr:hypothetical protein [uncultured Roseobacter sp.]
MTDLGAASREANVQAYDADAAHQTNGNEVPKTVTRFGKHDSHILILVINCFLANLF